MKILGFILIFLLAMAKSEVSFLPNLAELTQKAEQGDAIAQTTLGTAYYFGRKKEQVEKDYVKALYWYKKAAKQNQPIALYRLGVMYELGQGVEKDEKEAFKWYLKSAKLGKADAQSTVAFAYYKGKWVAKDDKQAFYWLKKAAEKGGYYNILGAFYFRGIGTEGVIDKIVADQSITRSCGQNSC